MEIKEFYGECPHCGGQLESEQAFIMEDMVYAPYYCKCGWKGYKTYILAYDSSFEGEIEE